MTTALEIVGAISSTIFMVVTFLGLLWLIIVAPERRINRLNRDLQRRYEIECELAAKHGLPPPPPPCRYVRSF